MRRSSIPQPEKIQQLLTAGRAVAEGFLRDNGQVPPIMLAFSDDGMILHSATSTTHPQVKDIFAGACRLLAQANRCTAVVLILEAWARIAPPGGSIDIDSAHPLRRTGLRSSASTRRSPVTDNWTPFFRTLSWNQIMMSINRTLTCG